MLAALKALFSRKSAPQNGSAQGSRVVTRFAPSPTGFMHIGGVRTALFAYLWARKNNGTFLLRIEDTDTEREVEGSIEHIQKSLSWLGIDWDYGPDKPGPFGSTIQSKRLDTYREWAQKLVDVGLAYPDPYTPEQLAAFRAEAEAQKKPFLYRNHRPDPLPKAGDDWYKTAALRLKTPTVGRSKWHDVVRGDLEAGPEAQDDFILIKKDGYPTYNFAHIIDDHLMGVTHIMRGDEFISSTPKFLSLYEALAQFGVKAPTFVTLPPIMREDKTKKLGKRDGAKDVLEYQKEGILPEAMVNFLALIGWNPGTEQEVFTRDELMKAFDIARVQKAGGAFNEEKLRWMNKEHLKRLPRAEFEKLVRERLSASERVRDLGWKLDGEEGKGMVAKLAPVILDRISALGDIDAMVLERDLDYYFAEPVYDAVSLKWKDAPDLSSAEKHLTYARTALQGLQEASWSEESVKAALWPYAEQEGRGAVLWPLRYALSGKDKSPNPFTLAAILGKQTTLKRVEEAIKKCENKSQNAAISS